MDITFLDLDDFRNPLLGAGQAKATLEVGKRLVEKGHTVTSLCSKYPGYRDRTEFGIRYQHIGWNTGNMQVNNIGYIVSIPFAVSKLHTDIIIECFTAPISTLCSPLFTKTPVVALPTVFAADQFAKKYHLPFNVIEKWGARCYRYFMPYIPTDEKKMRSYNPNITSRMIGQGVGDEFFRIKNKQPKHILFLGRFDMNQKGIDLLLEAYANVSNQIPFPLIIAGHGNDERKIQRKIQDLGMSNKIHVVGAAYGNQKLDLLSEAVSVAMPSRYDNLPLFSLEALASGHALVTFDTMEFSWLPGEISYKAKPFDVTDLSRKLVESSAVSNRLSIERTTRKFAKKFRWDTVAQQMEDFFTEILKEHSV